MSDARTEICIDAMLAYFRDAHVWNATAPIECVFGELPPTVKLPALGIIVDSGSIDREATRRRTVTEQFQISYALPMLLSASDASYRLILRAMQEIRDAIPTEYTWGLDFVEQTVVLTWGTTLVRDSDRPDLFRVAWVTGEIKYYEDW